MNKIEEKHSKKWIDSQLAAKPGAVGEWQPAWEAQKYLVGGKMFAMLGEYKDGRPLLTLKLPPERSDFLRRQYESVIPGYYSNKTHWSSFFLDVDEVPQDELCALLNESYRTGLYALPAKTRREIEAD